MIFRVPLVCFGVVFATVAGCTQFPALDRTITPSLEAAKYPALVPLQPLLAGVDAPRTDPEMVEAQLNARLAALRVRAASLRGSVLSGRERQRLAEGLH